MIGEGDLVVCVDASPCAFEHLLPIPRLREGAVYRITWLRIRANGVHVLVNGEDPYHLPGYGTPSGWAAERFRKVAPKSASEHIEALKKLPQEVRA